MKLEKKNAVITGGTRGIGRAISLALAEKNANVALNYHINEGKAKEAVEEAKQKGVNVCKIKADVRDFVQVQRMMKLVKKNFGGIDILVNNAGITGKHYGLSKITPEEWKDVVAVNLTGSFYCCKAALSELLKNKGKILNISSISGKTGGLATGSHYDASKAGVIGLTFSLARELAPHVMVNAIAPGPVDTGIISDEVKEQLSQATPFGRIARPEEIAHTVIYLLENDYVSGEVIDVNAARYLD
ncbi:MAG: 3-oxoacyl-ACP reductase FabG [Candidatus Korarchaeota archaeon]|nr:3-oxoacyl-ACP reductase FabG [Candidatus Korarchaeota archaeon]NIU82118.1 SDR family oxidoreductase [Candidatus Thorarchaeota archaeon]NIW12529.1 SDR family oxidoreductase [Candidatus Thorarchaeota archaeon]NIW50748.1 SDR family oxidoreductase [Candidatus Korarchaeota archaeon]